MKQQMTRFTIHTVFRTFMESMKCVRWFHVHRVYSNFSFRLISLVIFIFCTDSQQRFMHTNFNFHTGHKQHVGQIVIKSHLKFAFHLSFLYSFIKCHFFSNECVFWHAILLCVSCPIRYSAPCLCAHLN